MLGECSENVRCSVDCTTALSGDGSCSFADTGSAQEYQNNDFLCELDVSDPTNPLYPTYLWSKGATNNKLAR